MRKLILFCLFVFTMAESKTQIERFITYPFCLPDIQLEQSIYATPALRERTKTILFCPSPLYQLDPDFNNLKMNLKDEGAQYVLVLNDDLSFYQAQQVNMPYVTVVPAAGPLMVELLKKFAQDPEIVENYTYAMLRYQRLGFVGGLLKSKTKEKNDVYYIYKPCGGLKLGEHYSELEVLNELYKLEKIKTPSIA